VVCYPKRLFALIEKFLAAGTVKNFLCTIKFQGATDFETQARFVNGHNLVVDGGISAGRPASVMQASWRAISNALDPAHQPA
jgi:hypothetical protein